MPALDKFGKGRHCIFWKRFYTAGLGHAKAHFGGQGGAAVMKTVVWNVNGFAPASAKAFAHPRQVQSRHFLLSGNQDPVSAFRSRASLVLEPGQRPGDAGALDTGTEGAKPHALRHGHRSL